MKSSRELAKNNPRIISNECKDISEETNAEFYKSDIPITDITFVLSIKEILKETAFLKLGTLESERVAIEKSSVYNEAWGALQDLNSELYEQLTCNQEDISEEFFLLGFLEGCKLMKLMVEKNGW